MRYWVYINDKVEGPFAEDKLVTLEGFTPDTLICSEDAANSGNQEWVKASSIFEFDQVANESQGATASNADTPTADTHNSEVSAILLSKLDSLTQQLTNLQSKLDNIQVKLDESISNQQKVAEEVAAARNVAAVEQPNNFFVSQPNEAPAESPKSDFTLSPSAEPEADSNLDSNPEPVSTTQPQQETLSSSLSIDLDKDGDITDGLADQKENDVVLNAALNSMQGQQENNPKDEKENTFQDLLTPEQAKDLADEAAAKKNQPAESSDKTNAQENTQAEENAQKEAVLSEFSSPNSNEEVIDQIIKEKEEEKEEEKAKPKDKRSVSQYIAAGAAALAATFVGLKGGQKKEKPAVEGEPVQKEQPTTENSSTEKPASAEQQPAQPQQSAPSEMPGLESTPAEQPAPAEIPGVEATPTEQQLAQSQEPEAEPPLEQVNKPEPQPNDQSQQTETPEPAPAAEQQPADEFLQPVAAPNQGLPSIGDELSQPQTEEDKKETTLQELVPGAKNEKTDAIITEDDLNEVFVDRPSQEDASVDQLLGTAPTPEAPKAAEPSSLDLPSLATVSSDKPAETAMPLGNPNELTEIELKEGSTYLISDFVPPASSKEIEAAYAKKVQGDQPVAHNPQNNTAGKTNKEDSQEIQEIVATPKQVSQPTEQPQQPAPTAQPQQPAAAPASAEKNPAPVNNTPSDVTVSQIVLENTIKPKRGAALDIKTVPMVPEPANSDRLQIDGMDDGINTQHDLQSADVKPAGKATKMIVGSLIILLLGGAIYAILGFMNLIPAKYNLLSSQQEQAEAKQKAQLDEMLDDSVEEVAPVQIPEDSQQPMMGNDFQTPTLDPKETILEEAKNYRLSNGQTLQNYVESRHPAMINSITWDVKDSASADNYTVWIKVPPENSQSFKSNYVFNYNVTTKMLQPTTSETKNFVSSLMGN